MKKKIFENFEEFVGDILIPTKYFIDVNEDGREIKIPGLYYKITVTKDAIKLCDIQDHICHDIPKTVVIETLKDTPSITKKAREGVASILYTFINSKPELLAFCRANRIGGTGIIQTKVSEKPRTTTRKEWKSFIIRMLTKRKEWKTLEIFKKKGLPF